MAVYSMTGFANASADVASTHETASPADNLAQRLPAQTGTAVSIELRSVNGRFLDLGFRLPDELRSLEPALRDMLTKAFRRGKIELRLNTRATTETQWPQPQPDQLNRLVRLESTIQGWMPRAQALTVHEIL